MSLPKFEVPVGAINGVNTTFFVSTPYSSGSTAFFLNGQLKRIDFDDGWFETNPASGEVTAKEPPVTGDVVQIFYLDTSPALPGEEVTPLRGRITSLGGSAVAGRLRDSEVLVGAVLLSGGVGGRLIDPEPVGGLLDETERLSGRLAEVC